MLDKRTKALLRAVLYPVQFERHPEAGIGRVLNQVIARQASQAGPDEYANAIRLALESRNEELSAIVPESHNEETVRSYLRQLSDKLVAVALPAGAGPLATPFA
jgi:hypothetical protein